MKMLALITTIEGLFLSQGHLRFSRMLSSSEVMMTARPSLIIGLAALWRCW